jgi:hypothetical protein
MEERERSRRVMQRSLDVAAVREVGTAPTEPQADPNEPAPPPRPEPERAPREPLPPSGTELRRRQLAWFAERARHEAARATPADEERGSK